MEAIVRKCDENSLHDDDAQEILVIMDYINYKDTKPVLLPENLRTCFEPSV